MEDKPDNGFPIMYLSTMALSVSFCLYPVTKTVKEMSVARFAAESYDFKSPLPDHCF